MSKLSNIIEGWSNIIWPSPEVELMAMARAQICADCKYNKWQVCFQCMCPIEAKCRSPKETCPKDRWPHDPKS